MPRAVNFVCINFYTMLMVGLSGLEPPTSRLSGVRSNRLSYKPISRPSGSHRSALLHVRLAAPCFFAASTLSFRRSLHRFNFGFVVSSPDRIAPPSANLSVRRHASGVACGGDKRDRTVDLLLAKQALSQLSYTPIFWRLHSGVLPSFFHSFFQGPFTNHNPHL